RAGGAFDGSQSIHDLTVLKDPSVLEMLGADPWQRASFREAFYGEGDSPEAIVAGTPPRCVTAGAEASVACVRGEASLTATFTVPWRAEGIDLLLEKSLRLEARGDGFEAAFRLVERGGRPVSGTLCSEWHLNLLSGEGPDRYYEGLGEPRELSSSGISRGVRRFRLIDGWRNVACEAELDRECTVLRSPVETASLSEAGAEKIHQGVCLRVLFPVSLPAGGESTYIIKWRYKSVA
ncbi:MAG: alpha-amylase/4-alpha-glucanotransferase domain-containing protein, partial [Verrucomicrobiota bacterium]